ncbi:MAG TPA: PAS domain-containing protein [Vicinamibacterales bacterium]|nr:PAS domain-containing protein [Vicinamibacterales bacterium]
MSGSADHVRGEHERHTRVEDLLRASEESLRLLVETIPGFVCITTPEGALEQVNRQVLEYFGRPLEELQRWGTTDALHPDDLARTVAAWMHAVTTGVSFESEHRLRRADGAYRWFQARANPLRSSDGRIARWYMLITDIDDRKRAEDALVAVEQDSRSIIDTIPGYVATMSAAGEIQLVNKPLLDYTGRSLEQLQEWGNGDVVHPDDLPRVSTIWRNSIQTGDLLEFEHRLRRADGAYRWFHLRGLPARDEAGTIFRWYVLLIDIDDRRNAEEALRRTQARLSRSAQIATVGELAASIAHEVNQPLAAVVANAHACLRWLAATPPNIEKAVEAADRIVRDGKDAGEVVRRVRSLFKHDAVERVAVDLNEVITHMLRLLDGARVRDGVSVETDLDRDLPPVWGDRVQIQQLVLNLLLNGLEAMASVLDRPRRLTVRSGEHGGDARIEIQDRGVGLKDSAKAFEPFFTTKADGLGMGLAICRSIVEAHGGRLWAVSEGVDGTTFCFTLPLQSRDAHER